VCTCIIAPTVLYSKNLIKILQLRIFFILTVLYSKVDSITLQVAHCIETITFVS
jgi:hypothetical protein